MAFAGAACGHLPLLRAAAGRLDFLMPRCPPAPMRMKIGSLFLVLAAVAVSAYAAPAAHADHPTAEVTNAPGSSVPGCEVTRECFIPADVTVDVDGEVTWSNDDTAAHTVTSGTAEDGPDGAFDSSLLMPGTTFSHTFDMAGEYRYFCVVHPWMEGTVTVSGGAHGDDNDMEMDDGHGHGHASTDMKMPEGEVRATGALPDGTAVELTATKLLEQRVMKIDIVFKDSEHVNYDIVAVQDGMTVLEDTGAHEHMGMGTHRTMPLEQDPDMSPLEITVTFNGYGMGDDITGETGEVVFADVSGMAMPGDDSGSMDDDTTADGMEMMTMTMPEGDVSATGALPDGTAVELTATPLPEQRVMKIDVVFVDSEHVNYDIVAVQDGMTVLEDTGAHEHMGMGTHRTMPLEQDPDMSPLEITVTFNGYGMGDDITGETGDVVFANIVPEFGTVAALVLAVAIVSIVAVTARSRLGLVPRL